MSRRGAPRRRHAPTCVRGSPRREDRGRAATTTTSPTVAAGWVLSREPSVDVQRERVGARSASRAPGTSRQPCSSRAPRNMPASRSAEGRLRQASVADRWPAAPLRGRSVGLAVLATRVLERAPAEQRRGRSPPRCSRPARFGRTPGARSPPPSRSVLELAPHAGSPPPASRSSPSHPVARTGARRSRTARGRARCHRRIRSTRRAAAPPRRRWCSIAG